MIVHPQTGNDMGYGEIVLYAPFTRRPAAVPVKLSRKLVCFTELPDDLLAGPVGEEVQEPSQCCW
jgi:hypothetical protein